MAGISPSSAARALARRLAMQALYRWQVNPGPWQDLVQEFAVDPDYARADRSHFEALVRTASETAAELDARLAPLLDRKPAELDPVEHAILWVAQIELREHPEVPYRVVIKEAVGLARRFGASESHRYVNGVLDKAARELRPHEH